MDDLRDFVDSLELPFFGDYSGNEYTIQLENSNDFSKVFSIISTNDNLNEGESSVANDKMSVFNYTDGEFDVKLSANYDQDLYNCTISER